MQRIFRNVKSISADCDTIMTHIHTNRFNRRKKAARTRKIAHPGRKNISNLCRNYRIRRPQEKVSR